ncbi:MAG: hypothetical protein IJA54_06770 [Tyzzerella sp.]|nr:hypothetical protein [Tyzzerella sp.]
MNWNKLFNDIDKLVDDITKLNDSYIEDSYDRAALLRYMDRLYCFKYELYVYMNFQEMMSAMESENDKLLVQREAMTHINHIKGKIESFIDISRSWDIRDYQCKKYQEKMGKFFLNLQKQLFANN